MRHVAALHHRFDTYRILMQHRIREILLVSNVYDAYILEEDGSLEERVGHQYQEYGLSTVPRITKVSGSQQAVKAAASGRFHLVLLVVHEAQQEMEDLVTDLRRAAPKLPLALLVTDPDLLPAMERFRRYAPLARPFLWQNDPALLLAIIKHFEDLLNAPRDTRHGRVRVIILVEDSVEYYSTFLPVMYTALMELTGRLIDDGLNYVHRQLRMRSRAKVLLTDSYEEAASLLEQYRPFLLGLITDLRFYRDGDLCPTAGYDLARLCASRLPDLPLCIQSAEAEGLREQARSLHAELLNKGSHNIRQDIKDWLTGSLGFGDFVFRMPDGREVARAANVHELLACLKTADIASVMYHAGRDDFSHWMMARTEITMSDQLYPRKVEEFPRQQDVRDYLVHVVGTVLLEKQSDIITVFSPRRDPGQVQFMRLGQGSLGGKARGLGFLRYLLSRLRIRREFPHVHIEIPPVLVVCDNEFQRFVADHDLRSFALEPGASFDDIKARFLAAPLRPELLEQLAQYLSRVETPLAVRSSSLMEDSRHLPLAGLYTTCMLANQGDPEERLAALATAVKLVWASTYGDDPKAYFRNTRHHIRDESMAVVIQVMAGSRHGNAFYPSFSGVARSYNFYPVSYMKPDDGVVQMALGLGKTVVEGGPIVRFCPRYPTIMPQFAQVRDWLYNSQKNFYALDLGGGPHPGFDDDLKLLPLQAAEDHGVLHHLASVYQADSGLLADSLFYPGPRVLTFSKVLKDQRLRLGELLTRLLKAGEESMDTPVEMEFAVDLGYDGPPRFYPLQLRPMALKQHLSRVEVPPQPPEDALIFSDMAHGNGVVEDIRDLVYVRPQTFSRHSTGAIAAEVAEVNRRLVAEGRSYLLIGFGRWGSTDPLMGISVGWAQISGVKVLVEAGLNDFNVDPAQGTHFFQNVTAQNIGCLSVPVGGVSRIDWLWLDRQEALEEKPHLRHLRFEKPLPVRIDGRTLRALVTRPQ